MKRYILLILPAILLLFTACRDNEPVQETSLRIYLDLPINVENPVLKQATARVTNVETGVTTTVSDFRPDGNGYTYVAITVVPEGRYNIDATGVMDYGIGSSVTTTTMKAQASGVEISASTAASAMVKLFFNNYNAEDGLVIEEIFFTSSTYPGTQRPYVDDQYLKITNNSDRLIYADSLAIFESKFQPDMQWDLNPNIMKEAVSISWIYIIPGDGHSVPVEAGESIVIALNAKDHSVINPNSLDLSDAQFEIFDINSNTEFIDEDNPNAVNLIKWYSDIWSYTVLHNKGNKSYGLACMRTDFDTFVNDYYYKFTYVVNAEWGTYESNGEACFVPNSWVIDMVNLSIKSDWAWNVVSPALDSGWTYCAETSSDRTRYGLSVIRKRDAGGKLIDTNNSTADFLPRQRPSLAK